MQAEGLTTLPSGEPEEAAYQALQAHFDEEAIANRAARLVLEGGGRVLSLAPHRQSLEELFLQEARAVAPVEDRT